ncbi:hypothetical protein HDU89_005542 [Geranomyces variabilis]|nr:hypothetical protein HDU89_005542 [Geranomyces variabilis]
MISLATCYTPCARRGLALTARLSSTRPCLRRNARARIYPQSPLSPNLDYTLSSFLANPRFKATAARQAARDSRNKGSNGNAQNFRRLPPSPGGSGNTQGPKREPPSPSGGILTPGVVVKGLIGINAAVFLAWQYAELRDSANGDPELLKFMYWNFTVSPFNCQNLWPLLAASVSHTEFWHLGINMYVLWNFAPAAMQLITPRQFLGLYVIAGIGCSVASIMNSIWEYNHGRPIRASKGASGSVSGAMAFFAMATPRFPVTLFGLIEIPAWAGIGGFALFDLFCWLTGTLGSIDHAGHLGGGVVGVAFWTVKSILSRRP